MDRKNLKLALVSDWKAAWKFSSVQMSAAAAILLTLGDAAVQTWAGISPEQQMAIPYGAEIAKVMLFLVPFLRIVKLTRG